MRAPLKIILVGLPGSGKSTFGRKLARDLNFVFIDLDMLIEKEIGKKISEIFQEQGEGAFRELETLYLEKVLSGVEGFVLSTGGGTPCFNDNMDLINKEGISVFLDVPLEEITKRLQRDQAGKRPLFTGLDEGEMVLKLKNLMAIRAPYYEQAKIKLRGEDFSTELLMSKLIGIF